MNLLPEISVARLALLSRSRRRSPSRHDRQWRQLPFAELAHRCCECEKSSPSAPDPIRREPTERPNASCRPRCGMGEAGPRFRPAKPVGMAGGGLRQTLQSFIRTGRRARAFPPSLQSSSASLRHQRLPPIPRIPTNNLSRHAMGHGRYVAFQMAGAATSQNLFAGILRLIAAARY
jgi:hypothetical protein